MAPPRVRATPEMIGRTEVYGAAGPLRAAPCGRCALRLATPKATSVAIARDPEVRHCLPGCDGRHDSDFKRQRIVFSISIRVHDHALPRRQFFDVHFLFVTTDRCLFI